MELDIRKFFQASNPVKTLNMGQDEDRQYYIDFSRVRGGKIIEQIARTITILSPDIPTCQLFTGHIGSGKSTELLRLKAELEQHGFYVVYFESSRDLNMADVDITDILLAIARQILESLDFFELELNPKEFREMLQEMINISQNHLDLSEFEMSGIKSFHSNSVHHLSLGVLIQLLMTQSRNSHTVRALLRQYLEPRTSAILAAINREIIAPYIQKIKQYQKAGLVVIVDNLDRIINTRKSSQRLQHEYLFIDRGDQLNQLHCHLVYTIPLDLIFSNDLGQLTNRFGGDPKILPMVPVQLPNHQICEEGIDLLRQLVITRAFPRSSKQNYQPLITAIFDNAKTLNRLCQISGGHVRSLLVLLYSCLQQADPPISRDVLENVILQRRYQLLLGIEPEEWEILYQVATTKRLTGLINSHALLRSLWVFEYRYQKEYWFDVNPILKETEEFKQFRN